eukprot:6080741-Prymnesium_polylepis.1
MRERGESEQDAGSAQGGALRVSRVGALTAVARKRRLQARDEGVRQHQGAERPEDLVMREQHAHGDSLGGVATIAVVAAVVAVVAIVAAAGGDIGVVGVISKPPHPPTARGGAVSRRRRCTAARAAAPQQQGDPKQQRGVDRAEHQPGQARREHKEGAAKQRPDADARDDAAGGHTHGGRALVGHRVDLLEVRHSGGDDRGRADARHGARDGERAEREAAGEDGERANLEEQAARDDPRLGHAVDEDCHQRAEADLEGRLGREEAAGDDVRRAEEREDGDGA